MTNRHRRQLPVNCHSRIMNSHKSFSVKNLFIHLMIPSPSNSPLNKNLFFFSQFFFCMYLQTAPSVHEHKSNVTSTEKTLTSAINQTTIHKVDDVNEHNTIPDFKKISTNFTSFIDDLLHENVVETSTKASTTTLSTTLQPSSAKPSTSKPVKSIINDDDFIIKHLKAPAAPAKPAQGMTEIFSKHTSPTMNGLLKLAGCNIYGQVK